MTNLSDFLSMYDTLNINAAAERIGVETDHLATYSEVYVFDCECFVGKSGDQFHVMIGREDTLHDTLEDAATRLFFEHYTSECVMPTEWTTDALTGLLHDYSTFYGLIYVSADEMQHEIMETDPQDRTRQQHIHIEWLAWFIDLWEEVQGREDEIRRQG